MMNTVVYNRKPVDREDPRTRKPRTLPWGNHEVNRSNL